MIRTEYKKCSSSPSSLKKVLLSYAKENELEGYGESTPTNPSTSTSQSSVFVQGGRKVNHIKKLCHIILNQTRITTTLLSLFFALTLVCDEHNLLKEKAEFFRNNQEVEKALACYEQLITYDAHDITSLFHIGCLAIQIGQVDKAISAFSAILAKNPDNYHVLYNIAYCLKIAGRMDQAIDTYKKVLTKNPTYHTALFGLGMTYIQQGDFTNGWHFHEFELKKEGKNSDLLRYLLKTNTLAGKKIMLRQEGGLGDTLMFIRYAYTLKQLGARTIVIIQKALEPLLKLCPAIDELHVSPLSKMPACDEAATLMSLPAIFNTHPDTMSPIIPYLKADPTLIDYWREKLKHDTNFKVGICWQANVFNDSSRPKVARRGIPLRLFKTLAQIPGITLYSLQQHDGVTEIAAFIRDNPLIVFDQSFDNEHGNFMDTAAVMHALDLVISVDTVMAHLAGALNRPVWLLLPFAADWRWIIGRTDSPWYPSMTIFKQTVPLQWDSVMTDVESKLRTLMSAKTNV